MKKNASEISFINISPVRNHKADFQLKDWFDYLQNLHPQAMDLGLDRIKQVAVKLNILPLNAYVITITGTNGKGSTVKFLEDVYSWSGYQVATYTSPHLLVFNERIRINGQPVTDEIICQALQQVEAAHGDITLTYFEFTTLAALIIFQLQPLDLIILEVGLGGRLDATNIVDADLAIITNVALEHCEWLGNTRDEIAYEKAGIIRPYKPVIFGEADLPTTLMKQITLNKARLYLRDQDFTYKISGNCYLWKNTAADFQLPIPCIHPDNAAIALQTIHLLSTKFPVTKNVINQAMQESRALGRLMRLQTPKSLLLDVAHNPHATHYLAQYLAVHYPNKTIAAVFSMFKDKDIPAAIAPLKNLIQHWYIAPLQNERAASLTQLIDAFQQHKLGNYTTLENIPDAYLASLQDTQDLRVIFGSFHTVNEVYHAFRLT